MFNRHVTHLLTRYVHGQLRPAQRAQVINHVRVCGRCREAFAREERLATDLRRELPGFGQPSAAQLSRVWAEVWQDVQSPRSRTRPHGTPWAPGLGMVLAMLLIAALVLPLLVQSGMRAEAAPFQPGVNTVRSTASPTPGGTDEALTAEDALALAGADYSAAGGADAPATVAFVPQVGASPAPMPVSTVSPEAPTGAVTW